MVSKTLSSFSKNFLCTSGSCSKTEEFSASGTMGLRPCGGGSLQTWSQVIAILQILTAMGFFVGGGCVLTCQGLRALASNYMDNLHEGHAHGQGQHQGQEGLHLEQEELSTDYQIMGMSTRIQDWAQLAMDHIGEFDPVPSILAILYGITSIIHGIILFIGATKRELRLCRIWTISQSLFLLPVICWFLVGLFSGNGAALQYICTDILLAISVYYIWVVYAFVQELREEAKDLELDQTEGQQVFQGFKDINGNSFKDINGNSFKA